MIEEEKIKSERKPLPPMINVKYGDRSKKVYRLARIKSEDLNYHNIISLIKSYKAIGNNIRICLALTKIESKEQIIINNEKQFNDFLQSDQLLSCIDKTNLKIDFFYVLASPETIQLKENKEELEKAFQEMTSDKNSKLVLDFIIDYIEKQRDFHDKLYEHLKEKSVINNEIKVEKEDFSKEIAPAIMKGIKDNYDTLVNVRETNLNLNLSFGKLANTSAEDNDVKVEFKPFSQVYHPEEIEEYSKIVRDSLFSTQLMK